MIEIGNRRWRNLQEQVAWLTAMIGQATDVVKNIYGTVADAASLPSASTFSNGTTFAVGSAAPFEYYVAINGVWLDIGTFPLEGPAGTDGEDGNSIFITSEATTSGTTALLAASIYNPDGLTIHAGDMIFSEEGNVFAVTGPNSLPGYNVVYRCNVQGPQGATGATGAPGAPGAPGATGPAGADGATWYEGSDMIYDSVGDTFDLSTTDAPGIAVGDLYMITTDYTSDGHDFTRGDIFVVNSIAGTTCDCAFVSSILGPQGSTGATGADGAVWYVDNDAFYSSSPVKYYVNLEDYPDIKVGDLYLISSNYTSGGHSFTKGDVFEVTSIDDVLEEAILSYKSSILGPQGPQGEPGPAQFAVYILQNSISVPDDLDVDIQQI